MTDEEAKTFIFRALQHAGVPVVTDADQMELALGDNAEEARKAVCIQKQVVTYAEGDRQPDLHMVPISIQDAKGKEQIMYGVAFSGEKPKDYIPKTVGKAYKLMEQWPDGTLHALFAAARKRSYSLGAWNYAEGFSRDESEGTLAKGLAPRYGWHMGTGVPSAPHLMGYGDSLDPKLGYYSKREAGHPKGSQRVWVECSFDATNDYTDVAESNPDADKDIRGLCPFGGYYMFQESNLSNWVVASSIRLDRILPEEERQAILKEAGYNEELMWRKRTVRPRLKSAITLMLNRFQKEENAQKRLKIQQNLEILAENARKNEALIDAQSEGNEPTYADAFYEQMQKAYQSLDPDAVQVVVNERLAYYKQAAKDPAFREASHRLSPEEVGKNRQEIRNSLLLNPEWLDADEAKAIQKTDGNIAGFTKDGTIYLDPKQMTLETPIHEYVHLWDQVAQKTMPGLWQQGVALMKQTKLWQAVKESPKYQDIAHDDNRIASEVHARLSSTYGADQLRRAKEPKSLLSRLKTWNHAFWQGIQKTMARFTGKDSLQKVSVEEFLQAPFADLAQGIPLAKLPDAYR